MFLSAFMISYSTWLSLHLQCNLGQNMLQTKNDHKRTRYDPTFPPFVFKEQTLKKIIFLF